MEKSRDAFRTISEVADWLGTPTHVLRFWESRFSQVKPVKRAGGRRYYRPADMELLGGIKRLLHDDGLTIRGVQKILREEGVKHVIALSPPVDADGEAAMAVDVEVKETTDNVVQLSPQPSEPEKISESAAEPVAESAETAPPEAPVQTQAEPPAPAEPAVAFSHARRESPAGNAPEEAGAAAEAPAEPVAAEARTQPEEAETEVAMSPEAPATPTAPIAPAPAAPPRTDIFAAPPLSPEFAAQAPQPAGASGDEAEAAAEADEATAPAEAGPDLAALRPIYQRLLALRDRMAKNSLPPRG